jgi:putative membrane protein
LSTPAPELANGLSNTDLAAQRTAMAAERTLMAWIRTSMAMISFGFTIGKLGDALSSAKVTLFGRATDIIGMAYFLVVVGTVALVVAVIQYRIDLKRLAAQGVKGRFSLTFFVAILLSLLGLYVFADLVTRF